MEKRNKRKPEILAEEELEPVKPRKPVISSEEIEELMESLWMEFASRN